MEYVLEFIDALISLSHAMAPYILFGLLFAGILHELVPESIVSKHLGHDSVGSVIKATIFGIPLPVCSCGVIPLATSIKKSGASNGATLSFLISTPITGVDSILATYGMFGWAFTIYRVITSMVISMVAGILANIAGENKPWRSQSDVSGEASQSLAVKPVSKMSFSAAPVKKAEEACEASRPTNALATGASAFSARCGCTNTVEDKTISSASSEISFRSRIGLFSFTRAMKYAFGTLLGDIASPLLIGLLVGALITVAIPSNLSAILIEYSWLSYVIVISIAVPMYVCATASLPIAAGLMLAGVSPGAAFVFLSAGPATNTVTIGVVKKMLGIRTLYIYLGTIIVGSILFGFGLDYILKDVNVKEMIHMHEEAGLIEWFSSVALWIMVIYFIIKPYFAKKEKESCCSGDSCEV